MEFTVEVSVEGPRRFQPPLCELCMTSRRQFVSLDCTVGVSELVPRLPR